MFLLPRGQQFVYFFHCPDEPQGINSMTDVTVDQAEEEILVLEFSDESIEAAAGAEQGMYTPNLYCGLQTVNLGCPG
jgi:hypothetical protein